MRNFDSLAEREVLALAITLEEEHERVYADCVEGLRHDFHLEPLWLQQPLDLDKIRHAAGTAEAEMRRFYLTSAGSCTICTE